MNKNLLLLMFSLMLTISSCNFVKPFFIKNKKKEARKEKRDDKKEERKEKKEEKRSDNDSTIKISKIDSLTIPSYDTSLARRIIQSKKINYTTFQSKAKMHFESAEEKQNFTANFRLKKDETIWVSIQVPIVGEVARAIITPDSVKAVEKINKKIYLYSYKDIQKLINLEVDFHTLQEIIIGNAINTEGEITNIVDVANLSTVFIKGTDYVNQIAFNKIDSTIKQLQIQTTRAVSTSSILISLSQYQNDGIRTFSNSREYHIQDVKGAALLNFDINKYEFDKDLDFPFVIPKNYKLQK